jgi:hypothetical protein
VAGFKLQMTHLQSHKEDGERIAFCGSRLALLVDDSISTVLESVDCLDCLRAAIRQCEQAHPFLLID